MPGIELNIVAGHTLGTCDIGYFGLSSLFLGHSEILMLSTVKMDKIDTVIELDNCLSTFIHRLYTFQNIVKGVIKAGREGGCQ